VAAVAIVATGCSGDEAADDDGVAAGDDRPTVMVTTTVLGELTTRVAGDRARVEVLLPPGADPHDVEPSARQVADLGEADLVVANGLGLEAGFADALATASERGVPVLEVAPELGPIAFGEHGDDEHGDDEHGDDEHGDDEHGDEAEGADEHGDDEHGDGLDPHVWMDPDRMATAARLVGDALVEEVGLDRAATDAAVAEWDAEMRALDEAIQATLVDLPAERRVLVTSHDSLGYFAERYGFEVVGTVIPGGSTLAEPSAAGIAALADTVRSVGVPAVFSENVVSTDLVDALAAEAGGGVAVVQLYTDATGEPGSGADTYVGMMTTNAERIAEALTP
jgi:ABC-type Zn uptake system ZnuABC Zn-binding protein ZnuA